MNNNISCKLTLKEEFVFDLANKQALPVIHYAKATIFFIPVLPDRDTFHGPHSVQQGDKRLFSARDMLSAVPANVFRLRAEPDSFSAQMRRLLAPSSCSDDNIEIEANVAGDPEGILILPVEHWSFIRGQQQQHIVSLIRSLKLTSLRKLI